MEETMDKELDNIDDVEKIAGDRHKLNEFDLAPGNLAVELPCGFVKNGEVYSTIVVQEMTGYEEDLLAGSGPALPRINKVLKSCIVSVGCLTNRNDIYDAVDSFTAYDRMVALIAIRRVSLGDIYSPIVKCPNRECNSEQPFSLDLKDVEIVPMKNRLIREYETVLDGARGPVIVKWHAMRAEDEEWLNATRKRRKEDVLTLGFLCRVDSVNGVKLSRSVGADERAAVKILKSLTKRQRDQLRKQFSEHEGEVKTEVDFECPSCGNTWKGDMGVGQAGFFFPLEL